MSPRERALAVPAREVRSCVVPDQRHGLTAQRPMRHRRSAPTDERSFDDLKTQITSRSNMNDELLPTGRTCQMRRIEKPGEVGGDVSLRARLRTRSVTRESEVPTAASDAMPTRSVVSAVRGDVAEVTMAGATS